MIKDNQEKDKKIDELQKNPKKIQNEKRQNLLPFKWKKIKII